VITIQGKIPRNVYVAFSGGVDSMAAVDFLSRNHNVSLAHFHHDNKMADEELDFADSVARKYGLPILVRYGDSNTPTGKSLEEHWRDQRYEFFHSINAPVITCHHLDDCVETYIWRMLNGTKETIPYSNQNVIRPFRLTKKSEFEYWCKKNELDYYVDETNFDADFGVRNYIRNVLLPNALKVNPGLHKVVRKMMINDIVADSLAQKAWDAMYGEGYYVLQPNERTIVNEHILETKRDYFTAYE